MPVYSLFLTMKLICSSQKAIRYWVCILRRIVNGITISNMFAKKFHLTFGSCQKKKSYLSLELRSIFYSAYIQPQFNYCNIIWGNFSNYNVSKITKLQRRACKVILENQYENLESATKKLNMLSSDQNVFVNKAKMMYKVANGLVEQYVVDLFQSRADTLPNTSLRSVSNHNFTIPQPKYSLYKESLSYSQSLPYNYLLWTSYIECFSN